MVGRAAPLVALAALALFGCASASAPLPAPAAPVVAPPHAGAPMASSPAAFGVLGPTAGPSIETPVVDDQGAGLDDEVDEPDEDDLPSGTAPSRSALVPQRPAALTIDDAAFARALKDDPASLGSMSIGHPHAGLLVNGVRMPEGRAWSCNAPELAYGTRESIEALVRAIDHVDQLFPGSPPLAIGHVSARHGGPLSPHRSHQSGRDADLGYYYSTRAPWFSRATAHNLDRARTWELVKALAEGDAEMLFMDTPIQVLLRDFALAHGEDPGFVDRTFQAGSHSPRTLVRYVHGHETHLHVRFASPTAREVGARAEPFYRSELVRIAARSARPSKVSGKHATGAKEPTRATPEKVKPPPYIEHHVHEGDTLYRLAKHYGTSVEAIQKANSLKGSALKPKTVLRVPKS